MISPDEITVLLFEIIFPQVHHNKKIWRLNSEEITHVDMGALRVQFLQVMPEVMSQISQSITSKSPQLNQENQIPTPFFLLTF